MPLANINTTDLRAAIELGCRCMGSACSMPMTTTSFFASEVRPNPRLGFSACHSEAHVPGRHLNALLNAEDALGASPSPTRSSRNTRKRRSSHTAAPSPCR